jgi:pimeloyl-ACP methyl ester carboxylesterase
MVNNILFIRGFNTDNISTYDTYAHIRDILSQKNNITYFNYSPNDDINIVYDKLQDIILHDQTLTHMIGHSMGGGLLMKYIANHDISKYKKVILLMPLIYKTPINTFIANIPLIKYLYLPKIFILPISKLVSMGNFLNDEYKFIPLAQIVDMYNTIMLDEKDFIPLLNKPNVVLFYAFGEAFAIIPQKIRDEIKNIEYVDGLHECFNGLNTCTQFYKIFLQYI